MVCNFVKLFPFFIISPTFAGVKRIFTYILLLAVMANVFSLGQLIKAPVLFEHFKEHKQLDARISFLDFLIHHYSFEEHTDNDGDRDMQLPFKSHLNITSGFDFHGISKTILLPKAIELSMASLQATRYRLGLPTSYQLSQFKPPRS